MYSFLEKNLTIQRDLQVTIESKTFSGSNDPYLLIHLPLDKQILTINSNQMVSLEHHFTMPKKENKKSKSKYHYTLVLQDLNNQKRYKTHLFFDKLDRISLEPKLFSEDENFISIDPNSMKEICTYSLPYAAIISSIREMQKNAIQSLIKQIEDTENEIVILSKEFTFNRQQYIKKIQKQIESLNLLNSLGSTLFNNDRKFYTKLFEKLKQEPIESTPIDEQSVDDTYLQTEDNAQDAIILQKNKPKKPPYKRSNKKNQRRQKNVKNNKPNIKTDAILIKEGTQLIMEFDQLQNNSKSRLIDNMINKLVELRSIYLFSDNPNHKLFEIKTELKNRICNYLNNAELAFNLNSNLLAIKAQILTISDAFIIEILKADNVDILKIVLELDIITDSTKINILDIPNSHFTLVEWSVYFNADKCLNCLLNNKFSLDYFHETNSPFLSLLDNPSKQIIFSDDLNPNAIDLLYRRLSKILEERAKSARGDELILIDLKRKQFEVTSKIFTFCRKDRTGLFFIDKRKGGLSYRPEILDALHHHIGYQKSLLDLNEIIYKAIQLKSLKEFLTAIFKKDNAANALIEEYNSMPVDHAIIKIHEDLISSVRTISTMVMATDNTLETAARLYGGGCSVDENGTPIPLDFLNAFNKLTFTNNNPKELFSPENLKSKRSQNKRKN